MSAIASVRTVRASSNTPRVSTSTPAPVTPESAALKAFRADESAPGTEAGTLRLRTLASFVKGDSAVKAVEADLKAAEDAARGFKGDRDAMVTFQRRAIRDALKAGYKGTEIGAEFGVAGGTVSGVNAGLMLKAALLKGGADPKTVPSDDTLTSRAVKAGKAGKGAKAALIAHARTTGTLPEDGDVPTFTAAQTLARVQAALTAVKHITRTDGDTATVEAIREALETLSTATIA